MGSERTEDHHDPDQEQEEDGLAMEWKQAACQAGNAADGLGARTRLGLEVTSSKGTCDNSPAVAGGVVFYCPSPPAEQGAPWEEVKLIDGYAMFMGYMRMGVLVISHPRSIPCCSLSQCFDATKMNNRAREVAPLKRVVVECSDVAADHLNGALVLPFDDALVLRICHAPLCRPLLIVLYILSTHK